MARRIADQIININPSMRFAKAKVFISNDSFENEIISR